MRLLLAAMICLFFVGVVFAQTSDKEKPVRQAVRSFYDAFSTDDFSRAAKAY
jgi:hypothetical protein